MPLSDIASAGHEGPAVRWTKGPDGRSRRLVHLLRADPGLARRVPNDELERADSQLVAAVLRIPVGRWRPDPGAGRRPLAYVVLEGTVLCSCRVGERWSTEILGREDVLRPWEEADGITVETDWQVLEQLQVAIIEKPLATAAARWPDVIDELLARTVRRSRDLAVLRSVYPIRRLDLRLLILLRLLAGRWGHVSPRGVHVGVRLTHETLARLAGAQRPSVSTALARLRRDGLVYCEGREFILARELPREVEQLLGRVA
jgi:CRP/FNR family transcriptional regulator, cyclic AMP receptor protein